MKMNRTNSKPASEPRTKPVHIEFSHPTAVTVRIAASFNDWRPDPQARQTTPNPFGGVNSVLSVQAPA